MQVSEVVLGSWLTFGSSVDARTTKDCVAAALDAGIQTFDTADVYALGEAERVLGEAIRGIKRSDLVLASKCFWPVGDGPNDRGLSRKHVVESVEASLKRLGTDYLDLFQCHRYDADTPLEETVLALEDLVRRGSILYWGVSVWTGEQIERALGIAREHGGQGPVSNQPPYSLMERDIEAEVLPTSRRLGVGQIVFSPLAQGVLTGKYLGGQRPAGTRGADPQRGRFMTGHLDARHEPQVERFGEIAAGLGTTPACLALGWCLSQPGIDAVIVGATRPAQVTENAAASALEVPAEVLAELDTLFSA
jgi:aryl-alcohol dehydrogenase-like predicted oxidoreductase